MIWFRIHTSLVKSGWVEELTTVDTWTDRVECTTLLWDIGCRIAEETGEPRVRDFLFQRLYQWLCNGGIVHLCWDRPPSDILYFTYSLLLLYHLCLLFVPCYFAYIMFHCTFMFCFAVPLFIGTTYSSSLILVLANTLYILIWNYFVVLCGFDVYNASMTFKKNSQWILYVHGRRTRGHALSLRGFELLLGLGINV